MAEQQLEQEVLGARQLEAAAGAVDLVRDRVEGEVGVRQRLVRVGVGSSEERAHAGEELFEGERLDEVVVGARVEAGDAVADRVAGGEHEDRGAVAVGAQAAAHLEAVELGHEHVENDRVGWRGRDGGERLVAVVRLLDVVAVELEGALECIAHAALVVDDKDPHHVVPQTVRRASVGESRAARTAGYRPAIAPMAIAAAIPPPAASGGMTALQSRLAA
jgi:hypothetical protein